MPRTHHERLVVPVVVVGSGPEWEEVPERPREVVTRVSVDSLAETKSDPDVDGEDVQILSEKTVEERAGDGSLGENEDLQGVGVLRGQSDRGAESMMLLVDVLVQRSPVKRSVRKVVERVFKDEEEGELSEHHRNRSERNLVGRHAEVAADRVEKVDEREFAGKVGDQDVFGAGPELLVRYVLVLLQLPLLEVRDPVDDEPWDTTAKVDNLSSVGIAMSVRTTHLVY